MTGATYGPGYAMWLEHRISHEDNPRADCIGCFPPEGIPEIVLPFTSFGPRDRLFDIDGE